MKITPAPRALSHLAILGAAALLLCGCTPTAEASAIDDSPASWSYAGDDGPDNWGEVSPACSVGTSSWESPIDLDGDLAQVDAAATPVVTWYGSTAFEVEDTGHTIEAESSDEKSNRVQHNGVTYYLEQFHFHASSEHTIDGEYFAAELHLVHESDDDQLLVVGVLLDVGAESTSLTELLDTVASLSPEGESVELVSPINVATLLPADRTSVQYSGSLTVPPCSEGVTWNVILEPLTVSADQLAQLTAAYADNHRPIQPLNGRELVLVRG